MASNTSCNTLIVDRTAILRFSGRKITAHRLRYRIMAEEVVVQNFTWSDYGPSRGTCGTWLCWKVPRSCHTGRLGKRQPEWPLEWGR